MATGLAGEVVGKTGKKNKSRNANVLECSVCEDVFNLQGEKVPRLLLCGHTLCHTCLTRLPLHGRSVLCPFDRQPTELGDSGVWGLKKNFALLELLERLQLDKDGSCVHLLKERTHISTGKGAIIQCDENEDHVASIYCTVCSTHLCAECSKSTHSTRTLAKHKRIPLSEKPREKPACYQHPPHLVEFACLEEECVGNNLMCFVCREYGKHKGHKHTLIEQEAETTRTGIIDMVQRMRPFIDEISNAARGLSEVIHQIEGGMRVVEDLDGIAEPRHIPGTAEMARSKVQHYFRELHETLQRQKEVAMSVIDAHVRERLYMLRQQQEDITVMMSNVSTMCLDCERKLQQVRVIDAHVRERLYMLRQQQEDNTVMMSNVSTMCLDCERKLQQDDARVLQGKQELTALHDTLQQQQQHFNEFSDHILLDAAVPVTFTKDNRVHIGPKMEMRVIVLGLDNAGKSTILVKLKQNEFIPTIPTIGFNVETVEYKNLVFTIWDVGGDPKLRPLWKHYYLNTQALIFVVDSTDSDRIEEAYDELAGLVTEKQLKDAMLLVFANKQDSPQALSIDTITERLSLHKLLVGRSWCIQPCDAQSGTGLWEGLEWLSRQLVAAGVIDLA